jgi:PTS system ascorbate-specific IIA component
MLFFLVCHDPLGKALKKAIQHSCDHKIHELIVIDVLPSQSPEEISRLLQKEWTKKKYPDSIIVLTDIIGATPSNGLHLWLSKTSINYKGMAGINIPILLSALSQKNNDIVKIFNRMRSAGSNGLQEITN